MAKDPALPEIIEWEAYEYLHYDRSVDWFWGVGLAAIIIIGLAIFVGNFLLAILVAVGAVSAVLVATKHPDIQYYALGPRGVVVGETLYPYSELTVFWISEGPYPKLLIQSQKNLVPLIVIPIPETADSQIVHDYMFQHLDDEPLSESRLQLFMERMGF